MESAKKWTFWSVQKTVKFKVIKETPRFLFYFDDSLFKAVKFDKFSINTSNTSKPEVNFALLPMEESNGSTGLPPVKHSVLCDKILWIAREGGAVEAFDIEAKALVADKIIFPFPEDVKIIGLFKLDTLILAVSNKATLATWTFGNSTTPSIVSLPAISEIQAVALQNNFLAVGGKGAKNNLKVFDLTKWDEPVCLFSAKNTLNPRLNADYLVDIRAICFTTREGAANLAVANADGQIFLYDFCRQSSALLIRQVLPKKTVLLSVSRAEKDGSVIYTDVTGIIECYDLLKGTSYGRFKPQEGAVQSFSLENSSILITIAKDRFLRIFNYSTRVLLHKIYLKHPPNTLTITRQDWLATHSKQYEDSDDEEVWEEMTSVPDKKRTKTA